MWQTSLPNRKALRLKNYDYSSAGYYFLTLTIKDRLPLFGKLKNGKMIINDAGRLVYYWYYKIPQEFYNIECLDAIVMPDHFHCILRIKSKFSYSRNEYSKDSKTNIIQCMQWFKTMTTNHYIRCVKQLNWVPFNKRLWHRSYWDCIIRNNKHLLNVQKYIKQNPQKAFKKLTKSDSQTLA